jgi:glutathione synthase/RimK-type ligase-like ATP-grasp enzyme
MAVLVVVENPKRWPLNLPGAEVVAARDYLTDPRFSEAKRTRVFNLCRSYGYQTVGYYVSLLATARGHKPLPSVHTINELRQSAILRIVSDDLDELMQSSLHPLVSETFELSVYFGRNVAVRYDRLSQALFEHFPVPLLRAEFAREHGRWRLERVKLIAFSEIPETHTDFVIERAQKFFGSPRIGERRQARYKMAILVDSDEIDAPSDDRALRRFVRAARKLDIAASTIGRRDLGRIAEFDALFIRETTRVNHYTYESAARAEAEGLVVIDDAESIIRCSNKVYQAELFERHGVPCPKTMIVHKDNVARVAAELGLPCVLKQPDSSFSAGVVKAESEAELERYLAEFFTASDLIVAQEFSPSSFDWRVGVLDGRPLFVCKYHMVRGHWQIQQAAGARQRRYGKVEAIAVEAAPADAVTVAVRAASLIGRGLYGVDVKERDGRFLVMEVNDNPNIEAGYEDKILKDELYLAVMRVFRDRLDGNGRKVAPA